MSTPGEDSTLREAARTWLSYARSDLAIAANPAQPSAVLPETICFHAQQAVEKAMKPMLVLLAIDFPKTHDIALRRHLLPPDMRLDTPQGSTV